MQYNYIVSIYGFHEDIAYNPVSNIQVVGGMTWCIQASNFDVDVDLLFQENSSIGQKM